MAIRPGRPLLLVALALTLTVASVAIQRVGPTVKVEGEAFCPGREPCLVPALGGGWPLPFIVDNPQISVPNKLSLPEDHFRVAPCAINTVIYFGIVWVAAGLLQRRRQ